MTEGSILGVIKGDTRSLDSSSYASCMALIMGVEDTKAPLFLRLWHGSCPSNMSAHVVQTLNPKP